MTEQDDRIEQTREQPDLEAGAGAPPISREEGSQAVAEGAEEEVARPTEHAEPVEAAAPPASGDPAGRAVAEAGDTAPAADIGDTSPAEADAAARADQGLADRPEVLVAGAFAGGLLLAIVLRGLGRD